MTTIILRPIFQHNSGTGGVSRGLDTPMLPAPDLSKKSITTRYSLIIFFFISLLKCRLQKSLPTTFSIPRYIDLLLHVDLTPSVVWRDDGLGLVSFCVCLCVFNVRHTAHVIAVGWTSVRPSVRMPVRPSHAGIVSKRLNVSSNCLHCLHGSPMILVCWDQTFSRNSNGNTPTGVLNARG